MKLHAVEVTPNAIFKSAAWRPGGGLPDLEFKAKTRSTPGNFPGDNTGPLRPIGWGKQFTPLIHHSSTAQVSLLIPACLTQTQAETINSGKTEPSRLFFFQRQKAACPRATGEPWRYFSSGAFALHRGFWWTRDLKKNPKCECVFVHTQSVSDEAESKTNH